MTRELTGRHVLIIAICAFGVIIAANMAMLFSATGSFPGLVVKNSYVAGVGWNARAEAQQALGWQSRVSYAGGVLRVDLKDSTGAPVAGQDLILTIGRPSTDAEDRILAPVMGDQGYTVPVDLAPGSWRVEIVSAIPAFTRTERLMVPGTH